MVSFIPANMPCCGVFAIAYITRKPFKDVFYDFKYKFSKRDNWRGRTNREERKIILDLYDVSIRESRFSKNEITLENWVINYAEKGTVYIVRVSGHVLVADNRILIDQYRIRNAENCRYRKCKVKEVWEILT